MERNKGFKGKRKDLPTQEFNGKIYTKYEGERYYSNHCSRIHVDKWKYYNGPIPKGYHIHHKDGNTDNNEIENLECKKSFDHLSEHTKEYHKKNPDFAKENLEKQRPLTKEWHSSEEGIEWHRKQAIESNFGHQSFGEMVCPICSEKFIKKKYDQKVCSNKCKSQARRNSGIDNIISKCEYCGESFTKDKYSKRKFCSRSCSAKSRTDTNRDN